MSSSFVSHAQRESINILAPEAGMAYWIEDADHRRRAAQLVRAGAPVGAFVRGVSVIWVDGARSDAAQTIYAIKGERRIGRPMMTILPAATLVKWMDADRIPFDLHSLFLDAAELEARLGTLSLLRVPIALAAAGILPPAVRSQTPDGQHWVQTWVPSGESPASRFVRDLQEPGVVFPGVTSMNRSGEPEIVEQSDGKAFSAAHGIPLFVGSSSSHQAVRGSFPILQVDMGGIHLIREGHFAARLFERLLDGARVDRSRATPAKFPLLNAGSLATATSAYQLHDQLVAMLDGTPS